jgi:hypothetical protein
MSCLRMHWYARDKRSIHSICLEHSPGAADIVTHTLTSATARFMNLSSQSCKVDALRNTRAFAELLSLCIPLRFEIKWLALSCKMRWSISVSPTFDKKHDLITQFALNWYNDRRYCWRLLFFTLITPSLESTLGVRWKVHGQWSSRLISELLLRRVLTSWGYSDEVHMPPLKRGDLRPMCGWNWLAQRIAYAIYMIEGKEKKNNKRSRCVNKKYQYHTRAQSLHFEVNIFINRDRTKEFSYSVSTYSLMPTGWFYFKFA